MSAAPRLAVVIPAYNAGRELGAVLDAALGQVPAEDLWVIDDGSLDDTAEVARARGVRVLGHRPNRGKASALRAGFEATRDYELVVTLDADGQHDPTDLPRFVAAAAAGDLIVGARPRAGRMPWHRRVGNGWASWITGLLAGQPVPDSQSGYRLHRRRVIDTVVGAISPQSDGYLFETEILVRAARAGFRLGAVPIAAVYEGAPSHFRPHREIPRFFALFARLCGDALAGRLAARPAARAPRGDNP